MTFIIWEEVAWGVVSGMAGKVDDLSVDWVGYGGERRGEWGRARRRKEEEEKEDEDEELATLEVFTLGLGEASSARARQ